MNHRAVIETRTQVGEWKMHVIAVGPPDYCQRMLSEYLSRHELGPQESALILEIISSV
jgi:hypothetical protein